jgi:acetate kinase
MAGRVLVLNTASSSIKYELVDVATAVSGGRSVDTSRA